MMVVYDRLRDFVIAVIPMVHHNQFRVSVFMRSLRLDRDCGHTKNLIPVDEVVATALTAC